MKNHPSNASNAGIEPFLNDWPQFKKEEAAIRQQVRALQKQLLVQK
jgi:hypothetical protein